MHMQILVQKAALISQVPISPTCVAQACEVSALPLAQLLLPKVLMLVQLVSRQLLICLLVPRLFWSRLRNVSLFDSFVLTKPGVLLRAEKQQ